MSGHAHDHHHHAHGEPHAHHREAVPARRAAPADGGSVLIGSAAGRLGFACLAIAAVWGGVFWAMS